MNTYDSCEDLYKSKINERNLYLEEQEETCNHTVPYLHTSSEYENNTQPKKVLPWNGIGMKGVQNLSSMLLTSLVPQTTVFVRLMLDEMEMADDERRMLEGGASPEEIAQRKTDLDLALARMERAILHSIDTTNDRLAIHEALQQLIVGGNALLYVAEEGVKCFPLSKYIIKRDPMGNPLVVVVCEKIGIEALPEEARKLVDEQETDVAGIIEGDQNTKYKKNVEVYTKITWEKNKVYWYQEIKNQEIPGTKGSANKSESPWLPLRMYRTEDSYSPSYVQATCIADLKTAEALTQAVTEGALVSAQIKHLVKPAGVANPKRLAESPNGAFVAGNPDDVTTISVNKGADMQIAQALLTTVEQRLSQSFMLYQPRQAERVTAEETRELNNMLERSLGSVYGILVTELMQPFVARKLFLLTKKGKIQKLPNDFVKPIVSVGYSTIGRQADLEKTARFMQILQQTMGPESVATYVQPSELIKRLASAMGMDLNGLVKTEQQLAEEQQAAQKQAMMQQLMQSGMADPKKLADAAATTQEMSQPPTEQQ
tara:strand:- start:1412 stop:3040 length:1629 start_codon:yes stop_codon:yes gene_type:complete